MVRTPVDIATGWGWRLLRESGGPPWTLAAAFEVQDLLLPAGIALISVWLMMRLRKRRRSGEGEILTAQEQLERHKQMRGMRGDLEDLMVEIEQMARRVSAQLDAKASRVEKLLDRVERRIAEFEAMEARSPDTGNRAGGAAEGDKRASADRPEADDRAGGGDPGAGPSARPLEPGPSSPREAAISPGAAGASAAGGESRSTDERDSSVAADPEASKDALRRRVYALADQGQGPEAIARELQEHVGKVELILALRQTA